MTVKTISMFSIRLLTGMYFKDITCTFSLQRHMGHVVHLSSKQQFIAINKLKQGYHSPIVQM